MGSCETRDKRTTSPRALPTPVWLPCLCPFAGDKVSLSSKSQPKLRLLQGALEGLLREVDPAPLCSEHLPEPRYHPRLPPLVRLSVQSRSCGTEARLRLARAKVGMPDGRSPLSPRPACTGQRPTTCGSLSAARGRHGQEAALWEGKMGDASECLGGRGGAG